MDNIIQLMQGNAQVVENDPWVFINTEAELLEQPSSAKVILPFTLWQTLQSTAVKQGEQQSKQGFWLSPDEEEEPVKDWLAVVPLIALQFPSFRDGRAYTQAYVLRSRLGWAGELRAVGDVLRDQLSHMRQCGFTSFAVRADKSVTDAIKGLSGISVLYGRSVIEPRPLFRRRE
jgi:uncharacterized protein (DUF934 family)